MDDSLAPALCTVADDVVHVEAAIPGMHITRLDRGRNRTELTLVGLDTIGLCVGRFDFKVSSEAGFDDGQLVVPEPPTSRQEIQEPFVREQEIPPAEYYPEGYHPEVLDEWPISGDLVVPLDQMPPQMLAGMGDAWQKRKAYKKHISELEADDT